MVLVVVVLLLRVLRQPTEAEARATHKRAVIGQLDQPHNSTSLRLLRLQLLLPSVALGSVARWRCCLPACLPFARCCCDSTQEAPGGED